MATAGAVVDRLLRRLASGARRSELPSDIDQHVAHVRRTLSRLQDVLVSVDIYFWVRTDVQDWMTKISQIVYDMENLLDEFEDQNDTESQRSGCITKATSLCSPCPFFLYSTRVNRMKTLRKRLDHLARNSVIFTMMQHPRCDLEQTDMQEEFCRAAIVGRDSDKTKIAELILQDNAETLCIIPIVGLVGLGKTTLARLIFHDQGEGWDFDLRIWIDLNRKFDLRKIAADIISQANETKEEGPSVVNTSIEIHGNLQLLKNRLQETLNGKHCLIVLDGLCSTDKSQLDELKEMLRAKNKSIKVLVTTSSEITAELMHTFTPYKLLPLSEDDCWAIFSEKAFGDGGRVNAHLETIGKQIAKRCDGLPALAHFLGSIVHNQVMHVWLTARDEPIWKLGETFSGKTKLFSSLNQIYCDMPSALKLCFLYLSVLPMGSAIDKEKLIQQWIALDMVGSKYGTLPPYVHGEMYIQDLLSIHFLQVTKTHSVYGMGSGTSPTTLYMHNFVHDFARHVACNDIIILDDREISDNAKDLSFQYALLTYYRGQSTLCSSLLTGARALHFLNVEAIKLHREPFELLKHLRVLNLSRSCLRELPTSIGNLKHLRYLDISGSKVQTLPSSMSMLINLEALDLSNTSLKELPSFIGSLEKLKYLNLQGCDLLQSLPATLGYLQTLEHLRLSCYDVSELDDSLCKLQDLRLFDLSSCTELPQLPPSFGNLMNLEDLNLSSCFNLKQLPESFGNLYFLRFLNMSSCYELKQLPGSLCNLLKLEVLILRRCRKLQNLPPSFGDIQSLRILDLTGCEALDLIIDMLTTNLEYLNLQQCLKLPTRPNLFINLTRLKFLNLSQCTPTIDCLQSLGYLFNLEYLNLSQNLLVIPACFMRLQKLHTLDLTGCALKHPSHSVSQMFLGIIHKMTGLKFLLTKDPMIVACLPPYIRCSISIRENWHITTDELVIPDLTRGSRGLSIAESANLQNRPELRFLKLEWTNTSHRAVHGVVEDLGEEVLEKLLPHQNLEYLELAGYSGFAWPTWMMNNMVTSLPNLVSLHLFFLGNCIDLPPLGQLINLRHLHIKDMPNIVNLEMGLSGGPQPFKKLTHLKLEILLNLEELPILSTTNNGNQQFMFPALEELSVLFCPNLMFKPSLPKCVKYEVKNSNRILLCGEPLGPLSSPSPVNIMITGCRISSSCLQWLESLKTNGKIVIDACVGDDGEAVTSLGLMGIKYTRGSSSSKNPNETANRSSSGTNILHELTTQDGGYVVDASGRQSSGESSLPSLQQNPATTGLGTSIVWKLFPKFNTTLEKSVERITSSTVIMPSMETFPTSHKLPRSKMSAQIPGARSLNLSLKQVQKATRKFSPSLKLSESGLWEIYKGILPDNQMVVVRRAKKNYVPVGKVHKESQLLSAINHWSLVTPLCSIDKGNEFIMISEYISNGSLRQHLHGQHKKILDLNQRILIAIDVAIALTYLHLSADF
ncbi:putative disease resistance protein RGA1 isoform X3 [Lolium rigidum]|uniref:putative disease resistance protein RGA1 isoform X3 n=1 Tax=Lolium rigidum TaxID=89674 RepID=UPI001F5DCD67|nr:putative disease resistance protein RGA1 isoform X3 [Lolium rigidum]